MHSDQYPYYLLHQSLMKYEGQELYTDVLMSWLNTEPQECEWLRSFKERQGNPIPPAEEHDLWRLYALSRVFELLLLRFQNGRADKSDWEGPPISLMEYQTFAETLGFTCYQLETFSPFYHEIVGVEPSSNPNDPVKILEYKWPCVMLGYMVFERGGVCASAGKNYLCPGVADTTTVYWAYRRKYRPYQDLSQGWGSNSQWRTHFRRDYCIGDSFYYNVDGNRDLAILTSDDLPFAEDTPPFLSIDERIELLTNRCFVQTTKPHDDQWPYDDKLRVDWQL